MFRYVVKLAPEDMSPKDEEHHFDLYQDANAFAAQNIARFIEFYSETRNDSEDYWKRHAEYHVHADPNK